MQHLDSPPSGRGQSTRRGPDPGQSGRGFVTQTGSVRDSRGVAASAGQTVDGSVDHVIRCWRSDLLT